MAGVQELDLSLRLRSELILNRISLPPGARAVDLGCGTGYFAAELADRGIVVTCVDVVPRNIVWLRRLHARYVDEGLLEPVESDLGGVPVPAGTFDAGFCLEVLEHVVDDKGAVAEAARVLKAGAVFVVSVPNRAAPEPLLERFGLVSVHDVPGPEQHVRPGYDIADLTSLLTKAGFVVTWSGGVGGIAYRFVVGVVSLLHLVVRRLKGQQAWTWADVEEDTNSPALRAYRVAFPLFLALARVGARPRRKPSTLVVVARRT